MTFVRGLRQAERRLASLDIAQAIADALGDAAGALNARVTDALSQPPGQDHATPWLRTGALRASIGYGVDGMKAVVGSTSGVAVDQELGTQIVPPRPFLASTAASAADEVVGSVAVKIAQHIADK